MSSKKRSIESAQTLSDLSGYDIYVTDALADKWSQSYESWKVVYIHFPWLWHSDVLK